MCDPGSEKITKRHDPDSERKLSVATPHECTNAISVPRFAYPHTTAQKLGEVRAVAAFLLRVYTTWEVAQGLLVCLVSLERVPWRSSRRLRRSAASPLTTTWAHSHTWFTRTHGAATAIMCCFSSATPSGGGLASGVQQRTVPGPGGLPSR